jgi:hypothetical protein
VAATFGWTQSNGVTSAEVASDLGVSGNLFNFKRSDDATAGNYASNPVPAGEKSYEVWLRAKFTGTFNTVENIQFWRSTDFSPSTGLDVQWGPGGVSAYETPVTGTNLAVSAVPSADPGSQNVSVGGVASGSLSASGYSDYLVLQLATTSAAAAGDTSLATFTMNYDES